MSEIIAYAKTVLFFLLFVNLLMQLLKGSPYERFVHPVCGMILVIMIIRPVLGLFGEEEKVLYAAEQKLSLLLAQGEQGYLQEDGMGYEFAVLEAYERELIIRLEQLLAEEGLSTVNVDFFLSAEENDFGTIRGLTLMAEVSTKEKAEGIFISPIDFNRRTEKETVSAEEIRIKNKLADFYQVDETNIYVTIKEAQDG